MTGLLVEPVETPTPLDDIDHFICCATPAGSEDVEPSLCGLPPTPYEGYAWQVACVVCNDLSDNDWCPRFGRCKEAS